VKPAAFSWRYVDWALGDLTVDLGLLKDALAQKNAIQAYGTIKNMLDTFRKLKELLSLHPETRGF